MRLRAIKSENKTVHSDKGPSLFAQSLSAVWLGSILKRTILWDRYLVVLNTTETFWVRVKGNKLRAYIIIQKSLYLPQDLTSWLLALFIIFLQINWVIVNNEWKYLTEYKRERKWNESNLWDWLWYLAFFWLAYLLLLSIHDGFCVVIELFFLDVWAASV